ncbi:endospore germination permease [Heliobacterium chlorum]|uniref:Endospore germination permease n=1 Tax=Heliobacterium chlorum TaxID=2698 RepID=A0ABR7T4V0_HELCL|nr:endospore germination permease [Heliobacterium chlorum]MBC9785807.1 endospore germination permease [Heliobacterium chlorum]
MRRELLSFKQIVYLLILFITGSTIILPVGTEAKQDIWAAVILAIVMTVPMVLVYARILSLFPERNLLEINEQILGKIVGRFINFMFAFYAFTLCALVLDNFGQFINVTAMPETPLAIPMVILCLLALWATKEGLEVIARSGEIYFPIIVFAAAFTFLFLTPNLNIQRLQPPLHQNSEGIVSAALHLFSFPFAETVIFMMIIYSSKKTKAMTKVYLAGLVIGGAIILLSVTSVMAVIGPERYQATYFPAYLAVQTINVGDFLQRVEVVVFLIAIFAGFTKISLCFYAACKGFSNALGCKEYPFLAVPLGLLEFLFAANLFNNTKQMARWASEVYLYFAFPFQVALPLILWIVGEVKQRGRQGSPEVDLHDESQG